jgi:hypothetical protein
MLVIYHPDQGTDNADKFALLASAVLTPTALDQTVTGEETHRTTR